MPANNTSGSISGILVLHYRLARDDLQRSDLAQFLHQHIRRAFASIRQLFSLKISVHSRQIAE